MTQEPARGSAGPEAPQPTFGQPPDAGGQAHGPAFPSRPEVSAPGWDRGGQVPPPPPGYVWAYPAPPPSPEPSWRPPRWLKIASVVWAVLLVAGAVVYALHGQPTVRDQTTIANARPVVDRAIVDVVAAAGTAPVVAVSGFDRVGSCRITPVRTGANYRREVDLYTSPGTESTILATIASHLPVRYHASSSARPKPSLYADAGDYVAVNGSVPSRGVVRVEAVTGCRPGAAPPVSAAGSTPPGSADATVIAAVLGALGNPSAATTTIASLACPSGGMLRGIAAALPAGSAPASLATALGRLSHAPAASSPSTYAYRSGTVDVVARTDSRTRAVMVTATSRC